MSETPEHGFFRRTLIREQNAILRGWAGQGVTLGANSNAIGRLLAQPQHAELEALFVRHKLDDFVPSHALGGMSTRPFLRDAKQLDAAQQATAKQIKTLLGESSGAITAMQKHTLGAVRMAQGADASMHMMAESARVLGDRRIMGKFSPDYARSVAQEIGSRMGQEFDLLQQGSKQAAQLYRAETSPVLQLLDKVRNALSSPGAPAPVDALPAVRTTSRATQTANTITQAATPNHASGGRNGMIIGGAVIGAALVGGYLLSRDGQRQPDWRTRAQQPPLPQQRGV